MPLTGQQRSQLHEALMNGFPTLGHLERMVSFKIDKNLRAITGSGDLESIVFELITIADSFGWICELISGACEYNPGNEKLRVIKEELLPILNQETFSAPRTDNPPQRTNQDPVSQSNQEEPRTFWQPSRFRNHDQALEAEEYEQNFRQFLRDGHITGEIRHEQLRQSSRLSREKIERIERKVNEEYELEEQKYEQALSRVIWRFIIFELFFSPKLRSVSPCSKLCDDDLKIIYSRLKRNALRRATNRFIPSAKILVLIAVITYFGYSWVSSIPKPNLTQPLPPLQVDVSNKISSGEKSLFPPYFFKENMSKDRKLIIDTFKEAQTTEQYEEVVRLFNTYLETTDNEGKKINRNDPEARIFKNNAMALAKGKDNPPLIIGVSVPIGGNDNVAMEMLRGVAQAQEEFNERNRGRLLEVVIGSDDNQKDGAENIAQEFVKPEKNILAVVGHNSDNAFSAAAPVYNAKEMVAITPTSFGGGLQTYKFAFYAIPNIRSLTNQFVNNIKTLSQGSQIRNILICFDEKLGSSREFAESFNHSLEAKGIKKNFTTCNLDEELDSKKISAILNEAVNNNADALLLAPNVNKIEKAVDIAKENKNRQSSNKRSLILLGSPTMNTYKTLEGKDAVQGMKMAVPWKPKDGKGEDFRKKANELWGGDINWRTAMTYDVTNTIIQILKENKGTKVSLEQLRNYSGEGATGNISFGTQRNLSVSLLEVQENSNDKETGYKFEPL